MIETPVETLLPATPHPECFDSPDTKVVLTNFRSADLMRSVTRMIRYEIAACLTRILPFCPFSVLSCDSAEPMIRQQFIGRQVGLDRPVYAHMPQVTETERVRNLAPDEGANVVDKENGKMSPRLLQKLSALLLISRGLMGNAPFEKKMESVLSHILSGLEDAADTVVWLEVDDQVFGSKPDEISSSIATQEIRVEGEIRGSLVINFPQERDLLAEEKYFLEETADLIGRQIEISGLWERLRLSEERYKKLASNLAKEMWSRTEALAKETGYLEGILRSSEDMIITTDLDQRIVEFNPGSEKILGYTAEEMQGRKITELWIDSDERERLMEEVFISGGIRNYQTQLKTKSGGMVEISLSLSLLKDEEGHILGTVGVSKDIGKESAIRRELERLNQNYREAIHFINHEAKNSLVVMGGFLRRLLKSETDTVRNDQLRIVYHHSKFLEAMSRDFLVMAELEHGEFQVRKRPIKKLL